MRPRLGAGREDRLHVLGCISGARDDDDGPISAMSVPRGDRSPFAPMVNSQTASRASTTVAPGPNPPAGIRVAEQGRHGEEIDHQGRSTTFLGKRTARGRFKEHDEHGRSLAADRRRNVKTKSGYGDRSIRCGTSFRRRASVHVPLWAERQQRGHGGRRRSTTKSEKELDEKMFVIIRPTFSSVAIPAT
jgi:hypothetical protein